MKLFLRKTLKNIDTFSLAISLNDVKGEINVKNIHSFLLARYIAGQQPSDRPIIIISYGKNFILFNKKS